MLDYCKIVAYCLMPNHFHLMIFVTSPIIELGKNNIYTKTRTLNFSIGIMLRSYTNALQNQEGFIGSLFQQHTKAICLTKPAGITPSYFNTAFGTKINIMPSEKQYPQTCFEYIHHNPVKALISATFHRQRIMPAYGMELSLTNRLREALGLNTDRIAQSHSDPIRRNASDTDRIASKSSDPIRRNASDTDRIASKSEERGLKPAHKFG